LDLGDDSIPRRRPAISLCNFRFLSFLFTFESADGRSHETGSGVWQRYSRDLEVDEQNAGEGSPE
jgi:hypothetical protein